MKKPDRVISSRIFLIAVWLFSVCFSQSVPAREITSKQIRFAAGSSSATVKDLITGYQSIDYTLRARRGQTMQLQFHSDNRSAYCNIMPPGSEVAIFNGSISGDNWRGELPRDGEYTVRVYLMRSAARRNETAHFSLTVGITGTGDIKVAGSPYNATGTVPCSTGTDPRGSAQCSFGVIRYGSGEAEVHVASPGFDITLEKDDVRILKFSGANVSTPDPQARVTAKRQGDNWLVNIDDFYYYTIPDAVINGG